MLKKHVLSKNNISLLYQNILKDSSYEYNDSQKKLLANKIIDGLKQVSSKVDSRRVNQENINKILTQINNITINKIRNEINLTRLKNVPSDNNPQISQLTMERDFMANPHSGVRVYDRPQSSENALQNRPGARRQNQVPDRDFNSASQRDSGLLEDRLSQIQAERDNMIGRRNPKELPKGLQPIETNPNKNKFKQDDEIVMNNNNNKRNNKYSQDNYHLTNDTGDSILGGLGNKPGSLDDVFKNEITDIDSFQEDSRPLEARLNDLKSMRSIEVPNNGKLPPPEETNINKDNKKVSFVEEPSDDEDSIINYNSSKPHQPQQQYQQQYQQQQYQPQQYQPQQYQQPPQQYQQPQQSLHGQYQQPQIINLSKIDLEKINSLDNKLDYFNRKITDVNNKEKFQLVVDSRKNGNNTSQYKYNLSRKLNNFFRIELVNYSVPKNYYNINNNNNTFVYKINNEEKNIKIENGLYNIENLLNKLNENQDLIFSIGFNQKIKISSDNEFVLVESNLLKNNLGFKEIIEEKIKEIEADNLYELRQPSYFLLYIDNIDNNSPLAILNINGNSFGKIELNQPSELEHLDIRIVDENNNLVEFENRYHTLNFKLEIYN